MYGIVGILELRFLLPMSIDIHFDSGISVVEQRSLTYYLLNNLQQEFESYKYDLRRYRGLREYSENFPNIEKGLSEKKFNALLTSLKKKIDESKKQEIVSKIKSFDVSFTQLMDPRGYFNKFLSETIDEFLTLPIFLSLIGSKKLKTGDNLLREKLLENRHRNTLFRYIVNGNLDGNSHFFLVEQKGSKVIVKDSVGSAEREDFFDVFMNFETEQSGITYIRTEEKVQYSSGVCEVYPIIQMLFDARISVFNKIYRDNFEALAPDGHLSKTFYDALSEFHFGVSKDQNSFKVRKQKAEELKKELNTTSMVMYSVEEKFSTHFERYMQTSIDILEAINQGEMSLPVLKEEKVALFKKIAEKLSYTTYDDKLMGLFVDGITSGILAFTANKIAKLESDNGLTKDSLKELINLYKSDNFLKALFDEGYIDINHPRTYIRAGYAYWKTLEYVEMFDRRVTRHILNNENFSEETKKSMLSAIYPNSDSFHTIGEIDIYEHINDYYNGDDYEKVAQLLVDSSISYTKTTNDISDIFTEIIASQDSLENLPHFIAWNRKFREDIFKYVDEGTIDDFELKIAPFFFETNEVDKDYVRVVAGKYTFSMINEKDNTTDYSQIGKDFAHMLIIAEGNDRNDTFNTAIEKGKVLLHSNYHFRTGVFNWVLNKPTVGIKIKVSSMPVFNYIKNDDKEKDMFIKRLNVQRYLSSATTIDINTIKPLTEDMIFVFDTLSSSKSFSHREGDIDDFSKAILGKVKELKATVTSMRRQQSAAMAMAKPAASKETEASAVRPKKKTSQEQQPPVEEKSEEELTLKVWEQFKNRIDEILQKFPDLTNLKMLHKSI